MILIPKDKKELERKRPYTRYYETLVEFRDSNVDCVLVKGWTNKHAKSFAWSITESIKRYKMDNQIKVRTVDGEVYLIKKN